MKMYQLTLFGIHSDQSVLQLLTSMYHQSTHLLDIVSHGARTRSSDIAGPRNELIQRPGNPIRKPIGTVITGFRKPAEMHVGQPTTTTLIR